jgi:hypothetical protein
LPAGPNCHSPESYSGVADGDGDGEADSSSLLFFEGEGDASELAAFFLAAGVELASLLDFFVADDDVDVDVFLVDAVLAAGVVVVVVSVLWAQEATKTAPTIAVVRPRTNFFIMNRYFGLERLRLFNSFPDSKHLIRQ